MSTLMVHTRVPARHGKLTAGPEVEGRRGPVAHPRRPAGAGAVMGAASCTVVGPRPAVGGQLLLGVKVALVAAVALVGAVASVTEIASWGQPNPAVEYVQGHPAWAHVDGNR